MAEDFKACSVDGCKRSTTKKAGGRRGFCTKHYTRFLRHGDAEGGGTGHGDLNKFYDEVVLKYEGDECLVWPYWRTAAGYGMMWRDKKNFVVSRAVCEDTIGPAPTELHHAAHLCGKGHLGCVAKKHLQWKTPTENNADKKVHGTETKGQRNPMSRLTEDKVREIKSLRGSMTQTAIAAQFGVSFGHVSDIFRGTRWGWLE